MKSKVKDTKIMLQGHRGCTGYYPENSLDGFIYALELGVSALEIDVVVNKDSEIIVSHDPFFRHDICLDSFGNKILKEEEEEHNIFSKSLEEIKQYSCTNNILFKNQIKLIHSKPSLLELINEIKLYYNEKTKKFPRLTIEVKSHEDWEGKFQPDLNKYVSIIDQFHINHLKEFDVLYHSFDIRILRGLAKLGYTKLDYLVEGNLLNVYEEISSLDFKLSGLGIFYKLVDKNIVKIIKNKQLTLSTWTVNSDDEIRNLLNIGVTNIITDYPIMAKKVIEEYGASVL